MTMNDTTKDMKNNLPGNITDYDYPTKPMHPTHRTDDFFQPLPPKPSGDQQVGFYTQLTEFLDYTTTHGAPHAKRARHPFWKLFWTLATLASLAYALYQIGTLAITYERKEYDVLIDVKFDRAVKYPAVTVCNINPLRKSKLMKKLETDPEMKELMRELGAYKPPEPNDGGSSEEHEGPADNLPMEDSSGNGIPTEGGDGPLVNDGGSDTTEGASENGDGPPADNTGSDLPDSPSDDSGTTPPDYEGSGLYETTRDPDVTAAGPAAGPPVPAGPTVGSPPVPPSKRRKRAAANDTAYEDYDDYDDEDDDFWDQLEDQMDYMKADETTELIAQFKEYVAGLSVDDKVDMGHQKNTMVLSCKFSGRDCSPKNFTTIYNYQYGNCFTFNSGIKNPLDEVNLTEIEKTNVSQSSRSGPYYGLQLELFAETYEYVSQLADTSGFRILVHDQSEAPFPEEEGFSIPTGFQTNIGIRRFEIERLGEPYYKCWPNTTAGLQNIYAISIPESYTYGVCLRSCYQATVVKECRCADASYPYSNEVFDFDGNLTTCNYNDSESSECRGGVWTDYVNGVLQCNCSQVCREVKFYGSLSSSVWPYPDAAYQAELVSSYLQNGNPSLKRILRNIDDDMRVGKLSENVARVNIYFEDLNYERIYQKASYSPTQLLSDIGGQLGLWIGMSVLTWVEYVELLINLIVTAVLKIARRNTVKSFPN